MGFAPFLAMACEALVGLLYNASLSTYGGDVAVGAMAVYYVIGHIIAYLIMGLSMAMQPMISYNFGMRSFERVRQCTHLLITWSVASVPYTCRLHTIPRGSADPSPIR